MSLSVSAVPHRYLLADDFLTLDHWHHYGANDRDYELRSDVSVGSGNALSIADEGLLRLARDTDLIPGVPVVVSWWSYRLSGNGPATVQLRSVPVSGLGSAVNLLAADSPQLAHGWNHCVASATPPEEWSAVRISLTDATNTGGMIAALRVSPASEGEES